MSHRPWRAAAVSVTAPTPSASRAAWPGARSRCRASAHPRGQAKPDAAGLPVAQQEVDCLGTRCHGLLHQHRRGPPRAERARPATSSPLRGGQRRAGAAPPPDVGSQKVRPAAAASAQRRAAGGIEQRTSRRMRRAPDRSTAGTRKGVAPRDGPHDLRRFQHADLITERRGQGEAAWIWAATSAAGRDGRRSRAAAGLRGDCGDGAQGAS